MYVKAGFGGISDWFASLDQSIQNVGSIIMGAPQKNTQAQNNSAPSSAGQVIAQWQNPDIDTATLVANYYQAAQYGSVPPLPEAVAGETPQQYGDRVRAAIAAAEASGSWNSAPSAGVTAQDLSSVPWWVWAIAGTALVGGLVLGGKRR